MASDRVRQGRAMRSVFIVALAVAALSLGAAPRLEAKGCIKGAIVGGIAGHYAGHGVLGAAGGCVVGRHLANKQAREQQLQQQQQQQNAASSNGAYPPGPGSGQVPSSTPYGGNSAPGWNANSGNSSNLGSVYTGGAYQR